MKRKCYLVTLIVIKGFLDKVKKQFMDIIFQLDHCV